MQGAARARHQSSSAELEACGREPRRRAMTRRYALRDDQWERLKDWLPGRVGLPGAQDNRLFVDAVPLPGRHLLARSAGTFRRLPGGAHLRHSRWSHSGVWQRVFEALAQQAGNEYAMIGSAIMRAHQHGAGTKRGAPPAIGHSRSGLNAKIHAAADALGHRISSHAKAGARPRRRPTCSWLKQRPKP